MCVFMDILSLLWGPRLFQVSQGSILALKLALTLTSVTPRIIDPLP